MTESIGLESTAADAPTPAFPEAGDWFVLHTRSRHEKAVAADLAAMGIGFFLPLLAISRSYGRRKTTIVLPMFPGYIFLRGTRDEVFRIDRTRRIAGIIPVPDQSRLTWELGNIHMAMARGASLDVYPYLAEGTAVIVTSGPFRGLQGIVEKRSRPDRLLLQVQMLGRAMSVEIDNADLAPI